MSKFEDLKDGVIILKLFARIWPAVDLRKHKIRLEPRVEWEYRNNWDAIDRFLHEFRAPVQVTSSSCFASCDLRRLVVSLSVCASFWIATEYRRESSERATPSW